MGIAFLIMFWYTEIKEVIEMARTHSWASKGLTEHPLEANLTDTHIHSSYELFVLLAGDIEYQVEGTVYTPAPGDILLTKIGEAHKVSAKTDRPYERIWIYFSEDMVVGSGKQTVLHFLNGRPLGEHNLFKSSSFPGNNWMFYVNQILKDNDQEKRELYISVLLREMAETLENNGQMPAVKKMGTVTEIANYISAHLSQSLSAQALCNRFYISSAQLNRKFKTYAGVTVWEYITNKRLLLAQNLLQTGDSPVVVCAKVGFNNYTTFYRAYKQKFGISPKEDMPYKP